MRKIYIWSGIFIVLILLVVGCSNEEDGNPAGPTLAVNITEPADGDTISFPQTVTAEVTEDEIAGVVFIAGEDTFATLAEPPYSAVWSFYPDSGEVTLKVCAADSAGQTACDSITVYVPPQEFDFLLSQIAVSSHNVYLGWTKFSGMLFQEYRVYMSTGTEVDSTDQLVALIEGAVNDTNAFIDGLSPTSDYMFVVYAYTITGSCYVSNQLAVRTESVPPPHDDSAILIPIEGDTFTMGYSWSSGGGGSEEYPAHPVRIDGFSIYKYEVTCAQYKEFMDAGGYSDPEWWDSAGWMWKEKNGITAPLNWNNPEYNIGEDFPDYPVGGVSWYEAMAYARFVGRTLPTEAQWEYAARGTLGTDENGDGYPEGYRFPWGDEFYMDGEVHCNYLAPAGTAYDDDFEFSSPVGTFENGASIFGLMDMSGNVAEWCLDWFDNTYYWDNVFDNPAGPDTGTEKTIRGGYYLLQGYDDGGFYFRTTARTGKEPDTRRTFIGFRLVENY